MIKFRGSLDKLMMQLRKKKYNIYNLRSFATVSLSYISCIYLTEGCEIDLAGVGSQWWLGAGGPAARPVFACRQGCFGRHSSAWAWCGLSGGGRGLIGVVGGGAARLLVGVCGVLWLWLRMAPQAVRPATRLASATARPRVAVGGSERRCAVRRQCCGLLEPSLQWWW